MRDYVIKSINDSLEVSKRVLNDAGVIMSVLVASEVIIDALKKDGKLLVAGNGGSAGDAQHIAGEFINRFMYDRHGLPCIALTTDTSVITAISNDYSFEKVFHRQIEALGKEGDVFLGITTSGNSPNICEAMRLCKEKKITTIGLTGNSKCDVDRVCDYTIKIPSVETPRIQEAHLLIEHIVCGIVEKTMFCD